MKISYNLKQSEPATLAEPLVKYLEHTYDMQTAYAFKPLLAKINELRSRATSISLKPMQSSPEQVDKAIELLSAYTKYALIILNRFNWNSERGAHVTGLELTWHDSFQVQQTFKRHGITFDVFCCYYNLAVMYFCRAVKLSEVQLESSRKEAVNKAKCAAWLCREMKDKYYKDMANCNFHDTQFPLLDILENMSMGIIYRCLFQNFKDLEYKIGIDKIAALCGVASKYFFKAYTVASAYFMNPSGISDRVKTQILSFSYFSSLYFQVMTNTRYAKYYGNEMQKDHGMIGLVLAYQKKALRLLQLGLNNQPVAVLFNQNPKQKQELQRIQKQLRQSLSKNQMRNKEIYKQPQVKQIDIPPPNELPQQYQPKLEKPQNLLMQNEGQFAKLMSQQSYLLSQELTAFSSSKRQALQNSIRKLEQEIDKVYNDSFVNFYLQMVGDGQRKTIPRALQQKLLGIRKQGGKQKIISLINGLQENQKNANACFMQLRQQLNNEQYMDSQKRSQYGQAWNRAPSATANKQLTSIMNNLQGKFKTATGIDQKILEKYKTNLPYIETVNSSDEEILKVLPKPEQNAFAEANKQQLLKLKQKSDAVMKRKQAATQLAFQISDRIGKINYPLVANQSLAQKTSKEQVFRDVFKDIEPLILKFNSQCAAIKEDVQVLAMIAITLNNRNKGGDGQAKRDFEVVIKTYHEISKIFDDCAKASTFYDKLGTNTAKLTADVEDFVYTRKQAAQEMENQLNRGRGGMGGFGNTGGFGNNPFTNNLPDMFPGQKKEPVPEYVPPPIPPSLFDQSQVLWGEKQQFSNFEGGYQQQNKNSQNPFSGPSHNQEQGPLNFPSNPFAGQVFTSQFIKK